MNIQFNSTKGVGLIEVLVATVVISMGLLSLASMQGNFLSESGTNKAKAEAQILAEQKIEEFRNVITTTEFSVLGNGTDNITGTNASFTRTWAVADAASGPERKTIRVRVAWDSESITLNSELAWNIVGNSSLYSSSGGNTGMGSSLPSPSSDAAIVEGLDAAALSAATAVDDGYSFQIYRNTDGKQVIADASYGGGVGRQLTCGHVCLSTKGSIYLESATDFNTYEKIRDDDVTVCSWKEDIDAATSGDQMTITESVGGTSFSKREYICYYGGDCASETAGTYVAAGCPSNYADLPSINVRGGWRGNIGIVGFSNPTSKTLCFLGQIAGTTRRSYETTRTDGTDITQEGVNTNYECHDFLMVNNPSASVTACSDYTLIPVSTINKELVGDNTVAVNSISTDASSCNATNYEITGGLSGGTDNQRKNLVITLNSSVPCQVGPTTGNPKYIGYTCTIAGSSGDVVILGVFSSELTATPSSSSITFGATPSLSGPSIVLTP